MPVAASDLPEILKAHRLWVKSDGKRGILADLSGDDLSNTDLTKAYLVGANLSQTNLNEALLFGASLIEANLNKANLFEAYLNGANLSGADLSGADLVRAYLIRVKLNQASLIKAALREANLNGANLSGADLSGADLSKTDLTKANLDGTDLSKANLYQANLNGANLNGANLREANLREANIVDSNLRQADISGVCLDYANTSRWNIQGIICTHLVTGPDRKRIDYAPKEFEQKHIYLDKLSDIVLNLPMSELTHYVGLMTEFAINQHQPNVPIRFKGQEGLSDKTTKLSFIPFTSDDNKIRKIQDQLNAIQQNVLAVAKDTKEVRQYVKDARQPQNVFGMPKEIPVVPGLPAPVIRPAELERKLTERYNQLPQILKKVWECIQSSFPK